VVEPNPSTPDVLIVGDAMVDVSARSPVLALGGDVRGSVRIRPGGSGANAAVWAAEAGAKVRLLARVGDDLPGRLLREAIAARGVDGCLGVDPEFPTGNLLAMVLGGERSMVADRGANARLSPSDLPDRLEARSILVSAYGLFDPGSEAAALAAIERSSSSIVAVDTASWPLLQAYGADTFFRATARATLLLANEAEDEVLRTAPRGRTACRPLDDRYPMVVIKRGAAGARLTVRGGPTLEGRAPVAPVLDPTGAGDAFDGTLLAALSRGAHLQDALDLACAAGARAAASPDAWPER
jgi:ribokinase